MTFKKVAACLLSCLVCISFLTGCGQEKPAAKENPVVISDVQAYGKAKKVLKDQAFYVDDTFIVRKNNDSSDVYISFKKLFNNSNKTAKKVYVAFAGWDKDNNHIDLKTPDGNGEVDHGVVSCYIDDLNLAPGKEFDNSDYAWQISEETAKELRYLEVLVVRVESSDGSKWTNPYRQAWVDTFIGN